MNVIASPGQLRASFLRWALVLVPIVLLLGFLSGAVSHSGPQNVWFAGLAKPQIYPPPGTFAVVWTLLYALMGLALALIAAARGARGRGAAVAVFVLQLLLNLAWSPVFFGMHRISAALFLLLALDVAVIATMVLFWRVRPRAGMLLLPYLAWVFFASVLNWQILELNRAADGMPGTSSVKRIEIGP